MKHLVGTDDAAVALQEMRAHSYEVNRLVGLLEHDLARKSGAGVPDKSGVGVPERRYQFIPYSSTGLPLNDDDKVHCIKRGRELGIDDGTMMEALRLTPEQFEALSALVPPS